MATTKTHLYRSQKGGDGRSIVVGIYPGDGVLDPQWVPKEIGQSALGPTIRGADIDVVITLPDGKEVLADATTSAFDLARADVMPGRGTSLHDAAEWFTGFNDFWIPEGTEYCAEDIELKRGKKKKKHPERDGVTAFHYQLQPTRRMSKASFEGALNNMARAAIVRQVALARV